MYISDNRINDHYASFPRGYLTVTSQIAATRHKTLPRIISPR
nr:MAG TPA: hypothetical protein [Caudoviricetes sp.]